jgi:hypothetical protein
VRLLCERLPFEVVGCTTIASAVAGEYGPDILSLSVLTGDDVMFSVVLSEPLSPDNVEEQLGDAYRRRAAVAEKPVLVLAQLPLKLEMGVSRMLDSIISASGDVPVFGTLACDEPPDYHNSHVICNGEAFQNSAALLLISGKLRPRFFVENVDSSGSLQAQYGIITGASGCVLEQVNDMPFLEYIEDIGLSSEIVKKAGVFPVPFKVNYNEGTKSLIRVLFSLTPEGHAVFTSEMPLGGSMNIQHIDYDIVMTTAGCMADLLTSLGGISGVLLYSCIGRSFLLGLNADDEMRRFSGLPGATPYHFSYSGAEVCPLEDESGAFMNHTHSYSLVACVFLREE